MKTKIARYLLTAVGAIGLAGAPAAFAGDLRYDYRNAARDTAGIRADHNRLHEDLEDGRYARAARDRAELQREYRERDRRFNDVRRDRREIRRDDYRYGWR